MRVVVLADHSIFMAGIASRLQECLNRLEVMVVDSRQPDAMAQVIAAQPSVLIAGGAWPAGEPRWSLDGLLQSMPALQLIRLDPECAQFQVIWSEQHPVTAVRDLLQMIASDRNWPCQSTAPSSGSDARAAGLGKAIEGPASARLSLETVLGGAGS